MMGEEPLIQILMATYNGSEYLAQQIESIINQTYKNWELLISDDCSIDETLIIIDKYTLEDSRIRVVSKDARHGSARDNFLFLLTAANAEYIMFSDQDDFWLPDKIQITLEGMKKAENEFGAATPILVYTDQKVVNKDLEVLAESLLELNGYDPYTNDTPSFIAENHVAGCTTMFNHPLLKEALKLSDPSTVFMHDWWLAILASIKGEIVYLDEKTSLYRQHDNNEVGGGRSILELLRNFSFEHFRNRWALSFSQAGILTQEFLKPGSEHYEVLKEYSRIPQMPRLKRIGALKSTGTLAEKMPNRLLQLSCVLSLKRQKDRK